MPACMKRNQSQNKIQEMEDFSCIYTKVCVLVAHGYTISHACRTLKIDRYKFYTSMDVDQKLNIKCLKTSLATYSCKIHSSSRYSKDLITYCRIMNEYNYF